MHNGNLRPTISMFATLLIAIGVSFVQQRDLFGFICIGFGMGLYLLKVYLYSKGFFD